jgi:hypothetical protein
VGWDFVGFAKICVEFDTQEVTGEEGCLGQEVAQLRKDKRRMVQT